MVLVKLCLVPCYFDLFITIVHQAIETGKNATDIEPSSVK
jgi:hypothetical protein